MLDTLALDLNEILAQLGIKHTYSAPYQPRSNSKAEKMFYYVGNVLRAMCENKVERWADFIQTAQTSYNSSVNRISGFSPHKLLFCYEYKGPLERALRPPCKDKAILEKFDEIDAYRQKALELIKKSQLRQEEYANHRIGPAPFVENDFVLIYDPELKKKQYGKIKLKFKGPNRILKRINESMFEVEDVKTKKKQTVDANRLKFWRGTIEGQESDSNE